MEFLGRYAGYKESDAPVQKAVRWLLTHQEADGSWYGRWGIAYVYGTWAAITGLAAVGVTSTHPAVQKAVAWLLGTQNADGGWGESCHSDEKKHTSLSAQARLPKQPGRSMLSSPSPLSLRPRFCEGSTFIPAKSGDGLVCLVSDRRRTAWRHVFCLSQLSLHLAVARSWPLRAQIWFIPLGEAVIGLVLLVLVVSSVESVPLCCR